MKRKVKRWLGLGALLVVAGFAGLNALAFNHAQAILNFSDGGPRTTTPEQHGFLATVKVLPRRGEHAAPW